MPRLPANPYRETLTHVRAAQALARKYDVDIAAPLGTFMKDETAEAEFDRLLKKLS